MSTLEQQTALAMKASRSTPTKVLWADQLLMLVSVLPRLNALTAQSHMPSVPVVL